MKKYFTHPASLIGTASLVVAWLLLAMWGVLAPGTSPVLLASLGILSAGLVGVVILSLRNGGATQSIAHILHDVELAEADATVHAQAVPRTSRR